MKGRDKEKGVTVVIRYGEGMAGRRNGGGGAGNCERDEGGRTSVEYIEVTFQVRRRVENAGKMN